MKIGNNGYNQYVNNVRQNQENTLNKGLSKTNATVNEDSVTVDISDAAKQLAKIKSTDTAAMSSNVEAIKKAVLNGTYDVSPEKIANGMMQAMNNQREFTE
ncbi:MAG: flagellar biosynthesis anti-sigma factor FlgM [Carnobacterium inhibens]|uniref:flagellar biosynthesis anti-sigma factor FlgM n=1 Tax=Carnobacterium inhibens TaxID=147709 RepID=UPI003315A17A